MSGNALKKVSTRKYEIDEYCFVYNEHIKKTLERTFPKTMFGVPPSILSKKTFGDLDIVMSKDNLPDNWKELLFNAFGAVDYYENFNRISNPDIHPRDERNFFSLNFKDLQVDIILTNDPCFNYTLSHLSFGDASGFIGRIFSSIRMHEDRFGLKKRLVFNGSDTKVLFNFSSDFDKNRSFLDYSTSVWKDGFDSEEELFKYIVSSAFFNVDLFNPKNFNSSQRLNYRKRESTRRFVDFCMSNYNSLNAGNRYDDADICDRIKEFFPSLIDTERDLSEKYGKIINNKNLFSLDNLIKISGDKKFRIDRFMIFIKKADFNSSNDEFNFFVVNNSDDKITAYINKKITQFKALGDNYDITP